MQIYINQTLIEEEGASQQSLEAQFYAEEVECDWFGRSDDDDLSDEYVYSPGLQREVHVTIFLMILNARQCTKH